jgi:hypothetical protein
MTSQHSEVKSWLQCLESLLNEHPLSTGLALAVCGLLWRLHYTAGLYLNPDEALHYLVAMQNGPDRAAQHGWVGFYGSTLRVAHPPIFIWILRGMLQFGNAEWILRLAPMIAGALFPWFAMLWVRQFAGNAAGLFTQLFLTGSPALISLSCEVRAYTVAFLFLTVALWLLEIALSQGDKICMALFPVFLNLSILTEYCVMWMVIAAGCYALLRLWKQPAGKDLWIIWLAGQAGTIGVYALLYIFQVSKWRSDGMVEDAVSGWLSPAFLQPGGHVINFAIRGSMNQFLYVLGKHSLVPFGIAAFIFGLYRLIKIQRRFHVPLLLIPICLACLAGIFHVFPYGNSRHTAVLDITLAAGFGCACAAITRNRMLPILAAALLIVPIWNLRALDDNMQIPRNRHNLAMMHQALEFLHSQVPAGSTILTDRGTDMMLAYYLKSHEDSLYSLPFEEHHPAGLKLIVAPAYEFGGDADLQETLTQALNKYHLKGPVWVAAGGFHIAVTNPALNAAPFERSIAVFQMTNIFEPGSVTGHLKTSQPGSNQTRPL